MKHATFRSHESSTRLRFLIMNTRHFKILIVNKKVVLPRASGSILPIRWRNTASFVVFDRRIDVITLSYSFGCNEAHLRCMKNEAGRASYEASLRLTERLECASRVSKEHITSLCAIGAIHHVRKHIITCPQGQTSLFTNCKICGIVGVDNEWLNLMLNKLNLQRNKIILIHGIAHKDYEYVSHISSDQRVAT